MINLVFEHMNEKVMIMINGNDVRFGNTAFGAVMADISGLKLSYEGCCREWGDLELRKDWHDEAIRRFKDKIASLKTEDEKANFIVEDLRRSGYVPKLKQKNGFRMERLT